MLYRDLVRPLLFLRDAEAAHDTALGLLSRWTHGLTYAHAQFVSQDPRLQITLLGHSLQGPLGIAAGLDKNARALPAWRALGFGFAEVGTVTPQPQAGNPRPRLFRLPADGALINRLGFNSEGAEAVAARLRAQRLPRLPLGLNIGKNRDTPLEAAADDHALAIRTLRGLGDWFVINLSSPNTPQLRQLQRPEAVAGLVRAAVAEAAGQPVLVKLAPDFAAGELEATVAAALNAGVAGFVACNTTITRSHLHDVGASQSGGLSGAPLRVLATATLRRVYAVTRGRVPLIGVGGIASAEDAYERILAGANALQVYTGLVYEGPLLAARLHEGLALLLARDGWPNVAAAVGKEAEIQ